MSQTIPGYWDYRFETTNLALASTLFDALSVSAYAGNVKARAYLANMLGDPIFSGTATDADGNPLMIARGRAGTPASSFTDADFGFTIDVPAVGVVGTTYFCIRSVVPPGALPFKPSDYGLVPSDPAVSIAVLGVWA